MAKYEQSAKPKTYRVMWRYNRTHELYVGRSVIRFEPHGTHVLSEEIVSHPDFQRVRGDFSVVEEA